MEKKWILSGLILIIVAIILGAFGAHGLKNVTHDEKILMAFDTATKYQFFQGLGLLIVPTIFSRYNLNQKGIFTFLLFGTILFSGSIYLLTVGNVAKISALKSIMGPLTPLGGLSMIMGWTLLLFRCFKIK